MATSNKPTDLRALFSNDFLEGKIKIVDSDVPIDQESMQRYVDEHTFDITKKPPENSSILFYDGMPIGDRGNIVAITGMEKTRKTVISSAIIAALLGDGYLGFSSTVDRDEKILHLDTEQGYRHYYQSVTRMIKDAGLSEVPERFTSLHTRDADAELRIELIDYLLQRVRPAVLVLDGVTDLMIDINSQGEVSKTGTRLLQWSTTYNVLIVLVIHVTKSTGNMTGSIGTYLSKKCQTAIETKLDSENDNVSHVECKFCRDKRFKTFSIEYSEEKQQYVRLAETEIKTKGKYGDKSPEGFGDPVHMDILHKSFLVASTLNDFDLSKRIIRYVKEQSGDTLTAKLAAQWIKYYAETKLWIFRTPENVWMRVDAATSNASTQQTELFSANVDNEGISLTDGESDDLPF